ncbi:unnamed protein product [Adineta steineri]|uniref:Uncharacterized protein n=1 Tax=Adineta steineri TaxID=433720 RepID=A0A813N921_9BILA|nr:unnamed protein product [Adineta steineri]CAF1093569.1 unnamed protein product [Adineta steineri]
MYCHCHGCQILQGAPYQWTCIFPQTFKEFCASETAREKLKPSCHIFYIQRTILGNFLKDDGLPKYEGHKNKSPIESYVIFKYVVFV